MDSKKHICKFCKKTFPCGRSLGGHIRSHLIRGSGNSSNQEPKLLKSRSYNVSRSGLIGGNNSNSSVSEVVEPEEEVVVAMSLIMLSRDVFSGFDSLLQANNNKEKKMKHEKMKEHGKSSVFGTDISKKIENLEVSANGYLQNGSNLKDFEVSANGYASNDSFSSKGKEKIEFKPSGHLQNEPKLKEFEASENGVASNDQIMKPNRRKRKVTNPNNMSTNIGSSSFGEVKNGSKMKKLEVSNYKRTKFECTTCNKVFYSYQALGGHKASHKKLNGMVKPESLDRDILESNHHKKQLMKVAHIHECPICFRIFPSGQALGGHKRSHLIATNDTIKDSNVIGEPPSSETREFLDLNLPPEEVEEETTIPTSSSSNNLVGLMKPYWWVESHKHDLLLGLISN